MERNLARQREMIKGGVVGGGQRGGRGRPKRKGSGKDGVWMEMLLLQPSLEPELRIGKTAPM